jgi:hypothetical protein
VRAEKFQKTGGSRQESASTNIEVLPHIAVLCGSQFRSYSSYDVFLMAYNMKIPNWLKIVWWALLTIILSLLLYYRRGAILSGTATPFDIFAFVIWAALLLVPLFQEVSFFGVTLKQEIDELKAHVKAEITGLKSEIQNTIDLRTNINPQFFLQPPTDAQLPKLEEQVKNILSENLQRYGIKEPVEEPKQIKAAPDNVEYIFKVRYNIETELNRIYREATGKERPRLPTIRVLNELEAVGAIAPELGFAVKNVYAACSPAIHGEPTSEAQMRFIEETAPEVITTLKAIGAPEGDI